MPGGLGKVGCGVGVGGGGVGGSNVVVMFGTGLFFFRFANEFRNPARRFFFLACGSPLFLLYGKSSRARFAIHGESKPGFARFLLCGSGIFSIN